MGVIGIMKAFLNEMKSKIPTEYYNAFYGLVSAYDNAIHFLKSRDKRTFEIFDCWYKENGIDFLGEVIEDIIQDKLDYRFIVFMELYKSYLEDAVEDDCIQVLLDFSYMIPERMKGDFLKFGFLEDKAQEYVCSFDFCVDMDTYNICNIEPDCFGQVSLSQEEGRSLTWKESA